MKMHALMRTALGAAMVTLAGTALAAGQQADTKSGGGDAKMEAQSGPAESRDGDMKGKTGDMQGETKGGPGAASGESTAPSASAKPEQPPKSVLGKDVVNPKGEKIGEVSKIVGDQIVVSVGGFLGIGAHDVALSWKQLDLMGAGDDIKVRTMHSAENLKQMPEYKDPTGRPRGTTTAPATDGRNSP